MFEDMSRSMLPTIAGTSVEFTFHDVDPEFLAMLLGVPRQTTLAPLDPAHWTVDTAWVWEQLARCDYKPGWKWSVHHDQVLDCPYILIEFTAPDSRDPTRLMPLVGWGYPPREVLFDHSESHFTYWLERNLMDIERHEMREWLRRDGEIWNDPHVPFRFPDLPIKESSDNA